MADLRDLVGNFTERIDNVAAQRIKERQFKEAQQAELVQQLMRYQQQQKENTLKALLETGKQTGRVDPQALPELAASGYGGMFDRGGRLQERPEMVEDRQLGRAKSLQGLLQGQLGLAEGERKLTAPSRAQGLANRFGGDPEALMRAGVGEGLTSLPQLANFINSRAQATQRQANMDRNFNRLAGSMGQSQEKRAVKAKSSEAKVAHQAYIAEQVVGGGWNNAKAISYMKDIMRDEDLDFQDKSYIINMLKQTLEEDQ